MTATNLHKLKRLTDIERSYITGFLDGDGSIYAQIVRRSDYRLKFQIRVVYRFFSKDKTTLIFVSIKKNNYTTELYEKKQMVYLSIQSLERTLSSIVLKFCDLT